MPYSAETILEERIIKYCLQRQYAHREESAVLQVAGGGRRTELVEGSEFDAAMTPPKRGPNKNSNSLDSQSKTVFRLIYPHYKPSTSISGFLIRNWGFGGSKLEAQPFGKALLGIWDEYPLVDR